MRKRLENQRKNKRIESYDLSYLKHFTAKFYQIFESRYFKFNDFQYFKFKNLTSSQM